MPPTQALDLTDTVSFLSLLQCQKALAQMKAGDSIEIIMNDADMVNDLIKIVNRSNDRITEQSLNGNRYRIIITKGDAASRKL